jgi:hypothetical protein
MLLIVDERIQPRIRTIAVMMWAEASRPGSPYGIWEDPTYPDPAGSKPRLLDASDELALEPSLMVAHGALTSISIDSGAAGTGAGDLRSVGPVRLLDPYTIIASGVGMADIGATSSFFWSFADDAGGHSWNEYATIQVPYSPFFLSSTDVTISKHSEAIREGAEDFEYLVMLRGLTAALDRSVLETAIGHVLEAPGVADFEWVSDKDRTLAERTRLVLADALDA